MICSGGRGLEFHRGQRSFLCLRVGPFPFYSYPQGPHSHFLMAGGGGGPTEVHILYPKNSHFQNLSTQKNQQFFLAYPKKSLCPFFRNPKNSLYFFRDPKKSRRLSWTQKESLLVKISDPKNHSDTPPPVIKICDWCPWWAIAQKISVKMFIQHFNFPHLNHYFIRR